MVIFQDTSQAEIAGYKISQPRQQLNIRHEFKFNKSHPKIKDAFFREIADIDFQVCAIVVDKNRIQSNHLRNNKDRFYNFFVKLLTERTYFLQSATIRIDGSGDRAFKQELNAYLRKQLPKGSIKKLRFENSARNNLIQLADMVAGSIYRANKEDGDTRWLQFLQRNRKVSNIWVFK